MSNSQVTPKTHITFKVVSTMKHLEVSDVLGVDVRKDVKKVSKLLGKANGGGSNVTNTYSTKIRGYSAKDDIADEAVRESRIDVVAGIVRWLDSQDSPTLRSSVEKFHKTVASEKQRLSSEYGSTTIPAERYRQYLNACREVSVTVWVTQLVVTKTSETFFEGGSFNEESKLYHTTVKTKTIYTSFPITEEYLLSSGILDTEEVEEKFTDDSGVEQIRTYRVPVFKECGPAQLSNFTKRTSGSVEIAYVTNKDGERVLILRKKA